MLDGDPVSRVLTKEYNLFVCNPELVEQWDHEANDMHPYQVTPGSHRKAWWICPKGHKWDAEIKSRALGGQGCPYCSGKRIDKSNSLASLNPKLASQWHPTLNGELTPHDVALYANKDVWWKCDKGHEWKAKIPNRVLRDKGERCPKCTDGMMTSFPEQAIYFYVKSIFPFAMNRYQLKSGRQRIEIDVFIPEHDIAIEYDGYFHKDPSKDLRKIELLKAHGINTIRVRQDDLPSLGQIDDVILYDSRRDSLKNLNSAIMELLQLLKRKTGIKYSNVTVDVERDASRIQSGINPFEPELSFADESPELCSEWHYEKNKPFSPENFTPNSKYKAWWICEKGHEWKAVIASRNRGKHKCPYCAGRRASNDHCLQLSHPHLCKEWHPHRNGDLRPSDVTPRSHVKVWWICERGHEWEIPVQNRTGNAENGCPYCAGKKVSPEMSLEAVKPELCRQWHTTKNSIKPSQVMPYSAKRAWWICNVCGHEWEAIIANRSKGRGCPECRELKWKRNH